MESVSTDPSLPGRAELPVGIMGVPGIHIPYVVNKDGKGLPPLCSIEGMARHGIHDPANRITIIPDDQPVGIEVGKGGRIVKLVEAPSGHQLLPLDEKFSIVQKPSSRKTLTLLLGKSVCTNNEQTDDEDDE